jgi:beta-aspartyl-peptidase (threonine type)
VILVHGGCGGARPTARQLAIVRNALDEGYALLETGGSALDAVERAVAVLEMSGRFNAGKGAKRQMDGVARMDASLMDGRDLAAGAVASIEGILTPIRVARCVMERTPHVLLVGASARRLARLHRIAPLPPEHSKERSKASRFSAREIGTGEAPGKLGTVGAVAHDADGHVAAATSTGGIARMLPGRVGDSPLIGAGTYADDAAGAVSMTGTGETIIRMGVAKEIAMALEEGRSPETAGGRALARMRRRIGGEAGAIVLSADGAFAILHTTSYMASGYRAGRIARAASRFHRIREG